MPAGNSSMAELSSQVEEFLPVKGGHLITEVKLQQVHQ